MDKINKEYLFDNGITEEMIFCYYFPLSEIQEERRFLNPLREDDDFPNCRFYRHKTSNILYFKDWAWKNYDAIQFVMDLFNVNYLTACEFIAWDLGLITGETDFDSKIKRVKAKTVPSEIKVLRKRMTPNHLDFYKQFDNSIVSKDLEEKNVFALDAAWLNDNRFYNYKYGDTAFYYHLNKGYNYQCYNPNYFFEDVKFITSPDNKFVGWERLNPNESYAVLGKSGKCSFLLDRFEVNSMGLLSETYLMNEHEFNYYLGKFKQVFTLFDPDKTGKHLAWLYRKHYNTIPLFFNPKEGEKKDFSDNTLFFGKPFMLDYIYDLKRKFL